MPPPPPPKPGWEPELVAIQTQSSADEVKAEENKLVTQQGELGVKNPFLIGLVACGGVFILMITICWLYKKNQTTEIFRCYCLKQNKETDHERTRRAEKRLALNERLTKAKL